MKYSRHIRRNVYLNVVIHYYLSFTFKYILTVGDMQFNYHITYTFMADIKHLPIKTINDWSSYWATERTIT